MRFVSSCGNVANCSIGEQIAEANLLLIILDLLAHGGCAAAEEHAAFQQVVDFFSPPVMDAFDFITPFIDS